MDDVMVFPFQNIFYFYFTIIFEIRWRYGISKSSILLLKIETRHTYGNSTVFQIGKKLKIGKSEMKHVIHYYFLFQNLAEIVKSQNNFFPSKPNHSLHCGQCHIFVCWGVPICHKSGLILSFVSKHDLHILCPHFSKQTNSGIEMPHDRQCWAL